MSSFRQILIVVYLWYFFHFSHQSPQHKFIYLMGEVCNVLLFNDEAVIFSH